MIGITNISTDPYVPYVNDVYGYCIDTTNTSDPARAITFTDSAIAMSENERRAVIDSIITPGVLSNVDQSFKPLNRYDFSKYVDGTNSDLTGSSGDVMIQIPVVYFNIAKQSGRLYIRFSKSYHDGFKPIYHGYDSSMSGSTDESKYHIRNRYIGCFKATETVVDGNHPIQSALVSRKPLNNIDEYGENAIPFKNIDWCEIHARMRKEGSDGSSENGYSITDMCSVSIIQCLMTFASGTLDSQTFFGNGNPGAGGGSTGTCLANIDYDYSATNMWKPTRVYNVTYGNSQSMYLRGYWGHQWSNISQAVCRNGSFKFRVYPNNDYVPLSSISSYDTAPSSWRESVVDTLEKASSIQDVSGDMYCPFQPSKALDTANYSAYYCDYVYCLINGNTYGIRNEGVNCGSNSAGSGLFALNCNASLSRAHWDVGARLQYLDMV